MADPQTNSQSDPSFFSVRIVSIDYYMAPPVPAIDICYSSFQGGNVKEVPVIRIYGSTPAGQKTCLHVHRALPYLYVPCSDLLLQPGQEGDACINAISLAVEKALKLKGKAGSKRQHVHGCSLVRAKKFYGYHASEELFAKIYLYYPQDVSRAANLLLEGAVLDKIIQPHESHIPFLLQFLVDYNLCGMGHLHVSKMKFRNPVPDVFYNRHKTDNTDFQADSSGDSHSTLPIWLSSTIPDGWLWESSSQLDSSTDTENHFYKRQSTCELEGDAAVEEILNQQSMLFSSLSQTHEDVKMVQSLIPIWEEEFQRTGLHGAAMVSDPGKPLPLHVLRAFADEFDSEAKLLELFATTDTQNSSPCTPSCVMRSLTDEENVVGLGHTTPRNVRETPGPLKPSDRFIAKLSQESPREEGDAGLGKLSVAELKLLESAGSSQLKGADEEALCLLKWLASSQAEEDIINSDDELVRETYISPLLPASTIEKVLEKANFDFESESQKECQDILDCVEDSPNFQSSKETPPQSTEEKKILHTDDSSDNQCKESEHSMLEFVDRDIGSSSKSKHKRKRPLWGSLPLSFAQTVNNVVENDGKRRCSSRDDELTMFESSVRDLMRRKRSHRVGPLEGGNDDVKPNDSVSLTRTKFPPYSGSNDGKSSTIEELDVVSTAASREEILQGLEVKNNTHISGNLGSEHLCSNINLSVKMEENLVELSGKSLCNMPSIIQCSKGISANAFSLAEEENHEQMSDKCVGHEEVSNKTKDGSELCALAHVLSPVKDNVHEWLSNDVTVQDKVVDECLPFFEGDYQEEKEVEDVKSGSSDLNNCRQFIKGIPVHYQNDGSYLYMLTPAFSPPSPGTVHKWLLSDGPALCAEVVDSHSSLSDDCDESLPEFGCISDDANANMEQINQKIQEVNDAKTQPIHKEVITISKTEATILQVNEGSGYSQDISQISGPDGKSKLTPLSQTGFRDPASVGCGQQLTLLSIEVQAESRGELRSDPRFDAVNLIVFAVQEDDDYNRDAYVLMRSDTEAVQRNVDGTTGCKVLVFSEEKQLFHRFIKIISSMDPDILVGWDMQGGSLGFLAERAAYLGIGLLNDISRTPSHSLVNSTVPNIAEALIGDSVVIEDAIIEDEWGRTHASGLHVGGRVVLNVWRLMRSEVKLNMYTAEAVAETVLRRKIPYIHCKVLTNWYSSGPGQARHRCIEYVLDRAKLNLQLVNQLDMINRTSELARIFGIDFFSVLSRGSQYRVESMLLRLAHSQNYLAISPGPQQVASQPAMECLPLVMEPESGFYADPVVVLDFQSLYPSMIIAYNLCFSTCLGKVAPPNHNILGVSSYLPDPNVLQDLKREVLLTPNGVFYVPSKVRRGVLPRLLEEILSTRIMVKQAMKKLAPSEKVLNRIFNARQLALKLIANVTYGYTAAGFSGRMPCAELADSIVQCGRRTLERAISFVNTHNKWEAKVIYGDTDSMFVLLKGRSVKEAFKIGYEIASAVGAMNPSPVTLKMEKVYHPCFLLTKKRYVGYSYESPDQLKPSFDAKGVETIRRDTCAAVSKTMEQSLRLFFEHQAISKVKSYLLRQWTRILSGRVSLQDFIFAKEVRLGTYSTRTSSLPPAAIVATKAMRADPRAEPRYADRIPYVVVHGEPGARLADMVVDPHDLMAVDSPFRLNDLYYINKQIIPALQRVFGLVGANLTQWFLDMPRPARESVGKRNFFAPKCNPHWTRIDFYYLSKHCVVCGELVQGSAHLCDNCLKNDRGAATAVIGRTSKLEREIQHLAAICRHCGGGDWITESGVKCTSLACSVFFERRKVQKELRSISAVATELGLYPPCTVEWF